MSVKKIFKSSLPSNNYVTKKGKNLAFIEGRYLTDRVDEIAELEEEIKSGNAYLFIDPNESQIDTTLQDKIRDAQAEAAIKVIEDYNSTKSQEELAAAGAAMQAAQQKAIDDQAATATKLLDGSAAAASTAVIVQPTMSAATLLGVTNSASVGALAAMSNQK